MDATKISIQEDGSCSCSCSCSCMDSSCSTRTRGENENNNHNHNSNHNSNDSSITTNNGAAAIIEKELHIAPMIRISTREFRELLRILTKRAVLWTEMMVDETIYHYYYSHHKQQQQQQQQQQQSEESDECHFDGSHERTQGGGGDRSCDGVRRRRMDRRGRRLLPEHIVDSVEPHHHPIICQLGGIQPAHTRVATTALLQVAEGECCCYYYGYDEINLNLDCPSDRVQGKRFGAILMKYPDEAIALIRAMKTAVSSLTSSSTTRNSIPVSVKCRIGVDEHTGFDWIAGFIRQLSTNDVCTRFILHARPVLLQGLNPAQNRSVPALDYYTVYRLCDAFPNCDFWINGGISSLQAAREICYGTLAANQKNSNKDSNSNSIEGSSTTTADTASTSGGVYDDTHTGVPCAACCSSQSSRSFINDQDDSCSSTSSSNNHNYYIHHHHHHHHQNGSCTAPPLVAPRNLRGCMLGRAAMDHPAQFCHVDQYFYNNKTTNASSSSSSSLSRRQVLMQYCKVLNKLYPRRCCDDNPEITRQLPSPTILVHHTRSSHCSVCRYNGNENDHENMDDENTLPTISTNGSSNDNNDDNTGGRLPPVVKITSQVVDRSLRPFLGMFFQQPGAKQFRRACHVASRDLRIRNCGPAFILQRAVSESISNAVLDEPIGMI